MSDQEHAFKISTEFQAVYDLDDPRAYFRSLAPLDYRMPAVTCRVLRHLAPALKRLFGGPEVRVLDFACGFGVNGALLKHRLSLAEIYRHFESDEAGVARDIAFLEARREAQPAFRVGGIDIARQALAYGLETGLMDAVFPVDLTSDPIEGPLADFLARTDVVIETGAVFDVQVPALDRLIGAADPAHRPWIITAPRPDVDVQRLYRVFDRHGYRYKACNRRPIRYRKLLGAQERDDTRRAMEARGEVLPSGIEDGYFLVDLVLARPAEDRTVLADIPEALFQDP